MFEAFFNLRVAPFQLAPDPGFYFPSRGHSHALAYLKFGVYQQEGFIVVTGEIGAGKTTLVRTLLSGLDPEQVIAAQIVNTQLNEGELLASICTAFGVPVPSASKAQLLGALEAFFTAVTAGGRRALLVVDEAQNLGKRETEELRMLSNFQIGNRALLQSFLVGQPELRNMLASSAMEQLRQRVIASCHLGSMSEEETSEYIQHRLRHAGWDGTPIFDEGATRAIHISAGGIPRRINLLCTRLLLGAVLESRHEVSEGHVAAASDELRIELGSHSAELTSRQAARVGPNNEDLSLRTRTGRSRAER